jgi:ATP/maltotriose-dependent transcriptional regulator MalT
MQLALDTYDPKLHKESGATFGFDTRAWAGASLSRVTWDLGHCQRATQVAKEAVDWAREIEHPPSLGICLMYQSIVHQYNGEKELARKVSAELLSVSDQYGLLIDAAYGKLMHCWASDDLTGGEEAFGLLNALKSLHAVAYFYSLLADVDLREGRPEAALARIDKCIALCGQIDEHYYEPHLYLRRAQYLEGAPWRDRAGARRDLETALRISSAQGGVQVAHLAKEVLARHSK